MALGAANGRVLRLILTSSARPIAWEPPSARPSPWQGFIATMSRHAPVAIHSNDPITFLGAASLMGLAAVAALLRPAWRAADAGPMRALRVE
jgi:hypothetical protein